MGCKQKEVFFKNSKDQKTLNLLQNEIKEGLKESKIMREDYPDLMNAMDLIFDHLKSSPCQLDLHIENVMKRPGGSLVIIDPYVE